MDKLLYIGKSNKKFTYNHIYKYFGHNFGGILKDGITVYDNKNNMCFLNIYYFTENFKFITEIEYNRLIRKLKIKKINESEHRF